MFLDKNWVLKQPSTSKQVKVRTFRKVESLEEEMNSDQLFAIFGIAFVICNLFLLGLTFISSVFPCVLSFCTCNCNNEGKSQHIVTSSTAVTDTNGIISKRKVNKEGETIVTIKTVNWHKSICDSRSSIQEKYETEVWCKKVVS